MADSRSVSPQGGRSRSGSPDQAPPRARVGSPRKASPRRGSPRRGSPRRISPRPPRQRSYSPEGSEGRRRPEGFREPRERRPDLPLGAPTKICAFWRAEDSCKYGASCHFSHSLSGIRGRVSPSPKDGNFNGVGLTEFPRRRSPSGRGRGRGEFRGRGSRSPPGSQTVCHFWKTGDNCKFGDQCHFLHSYPDGPRGNGHGPPRRGFPGPRDGGRDYGGGGPGYRDGYRDGGYGGGHGGRRSYSPGPPRRRPTPPNLSDRPIVWDHSLETHQQRPQYDYELDRFSPPRYSRPISPMRRERSWSRGYERGPSPGRRFSPPPRNGSPHRRYHDYSPPPPPPRGQMSPRGRMSPRFDPRDSRGYSPPPRHDGYGSPPGRRQSFSPPTRYRGQPGRGRGGGRGPPDSRSDLRSDGHPPGDRGGHKHKTEPCYFFTQKQGCRSGEACNFIHAKPENGHDRPRERRDSGPDRRDSGPERRPPPRERERSGGRDREPRERVERRQVSPPSRDSSPE